MSEKFPLNPHQEEAAFHGNGPLLVLAGAGSGKTRVLTQRILHLVQEKGVAPWRILAVTFTNKAAGEMKHRLTESLGSQARDLWVSTFHSTCLRILRRHVERLGFDKQFAIYDDSDQRVLIKRILTSLDLSDKIFKPQAISGHIDRAKNAGLSPEKFVTEGDYFLSTVQKIYAAYEAELKRNNAMDFGDLIIKTLRLFGEHPEILEQYRRQFEYILVDEYQDTNPSQYNLIRLLTPESRNLLVVGDDDQSIYRFRGADVQIILGFQRDYPDAKVIRLEQNYRSTQNILSAANGVIRGNRDRLGKELWTQAPEGDKVIVYRAADERDEALFVAQKISRLRHEYSLSDFALFYRTNAQSRAFEDILRREKIPYKIFGGMKFYDRAEIKDMMAYLRLVVNPADSVAIKRVLNVPARGIGGTTEEKIEQAAVRFGVTLWEVLGTIDDPRWELALNAGTREKIKSFVAIIQKLITARGEVELDEYMTFLYEATGYWQMLTAERSIEADGRKENLNELVNVIDEYCTHAEEPTLEAFLDQISLASDVDKLEEGAPFVTLMTVHLAKGLEFPVVFVVGMEEGLFPHVRSLDHPAEIEEERRLCYVAMTRARKRLFMSCAAERRVFGSPQFHPPSRFLSELPQAFIEEETREERAVASPKTFAPTYYSRPSFGGGTRRPQIQQNKTFAAAPSRTIDTSESQVSDPIRRGARVHHAVFGNGQIVGFEGSDEQMKVTVRFGSGVQKKLLFKHANLRVVG